jgi:hypothetical protein
MAPHLWSIPDQIHLSAVYRTLNLMFGGIMSPVRVVSATTVIALSGPTIAQAEVCDPRYIPACAQVASAVLEMTDIFTASYVWTECMMNGGCLDFPEAE